MIQSRKLPVIVAVAMAFALAVSVILVILANVRAADGSLNTEPKYAEKVFGPDVISIEITADEDDWQYMLDNAQNEQFIMADVVVNEMKFQDVGIRPKGNSSLTQVAASGSDRYSFRLQFDEYIDDQTCFGLESFVLNNMIGDSTYMKEYVSYELMREAGVDTPYFGFANIRVNGEDWGLYLAVELYNDSYEQRVFGDTSGMLYNVKSMDMGGAGDQPQMNPGIKPWDQIQNKQQDQRQDPSQDQQQNQPGNGFMNQPANWPDKWPGAETGDIHDLPESMGGGPVQGNGAMNGNFMKMGGGMNSRGSSGGSLEYIDDNIESYSDIFDNVSGKGSESDYRRVIKALKALSEGEDLETYFNVDKILRYLAAHTFVVNLDSYSTSMAQNYYIYERDGRITILPWDYNLAWGGFQSRDAASVINFPIDTPVSGVEMSRRPLIEKLLSNTEYLERYHSYLQQLINNYFSDGKFEKHIKELDALISDYVKNDATAFCTYDQYKQAVSSFITLGNLRAESVQGQLNGTVPSTTDEQAANPDKLISAGNLNLSDLGTMMGGKNDMRQDGWGRAPGANFAAPPSGLGEMNGFGKMKQNSGEGKTAADKGSPSADTGETGQSSGNGETGQNDGGGAPAGNNGMPFPGFGMMRQRPQNTDTGNHAAGASPGLSIAAGNHIITGVSLLVLAAALIFAARYRKSY